MRAIVVIFTICVIAGALAETPEEKKALFQQIEERCKSEHGIDAAFVQKVKSGEQEFDSKLKCYSACFFKGIGVINADGSINDEVAHARILAIVQSAEKADAIVKKCKAPAEKDVCEFAGKMMNCLVQDKVVPLFD